MEPTSVAERGTMKPKLDPGEQQRVHVNAVPD
jgi:hypothetical protein